jgi:hypothetical protein
MLTIPPLKKNRVMRPLGDHFRSAKFPGKDIPYHVMPGTFDADDPKKFKHRSIHDHSDLKNHYSPEMILI